MRVIATLVILLAGIASAETLSVAGHWILASSEDPSIPNPTVVLRQDSATTIKDEAAEDDVTPRLRFRCAPGDTSITASIDWRRFISSFSTEAGFKVDDRRFLWLKWKVDQTKQVTSSPSTEDTRKLTTLLKSGRKLLVEITPYSESPVTVEFDLTGFADAIDALAAHCL